MIHRLFAFLGIFLLGAVWPVRSAADVQTEVRVLVAENQNIMRLTVHGRYLIQSLPALQIIKKGERLANLPIGPSPNGIKLGVLDIASPGIRIMPANDRDLFLNRSRFRGVLDIYKSPDGLCYAINRVDIEKYLYGVLHHEVAPWWPLEALKAQAIAARTYAIYQKQVSRAVGYDLKSGTSSQVYGGSTTERYRTKKAVDETRGQILTYGEKPFPAYFHATCAGLTAAASELWKINLPPIDGGVHCNFCRLSPHYYWYAKIPLSSVEEKLAQFGKPLGQVLKIDSISQTPSGRVGSLRITGTDGEMALAAKDFRVWIGGDKMRSTFFTVSVHDDVAEFRGKGWGHGVGMCQWGALGQALLGRNYEDILKFYYPGAKISQLHDA